MRWVFSLAFAAALPLLPACTETFTAHEPSYGSSDYTASSPMYDAATLKRIVVTTDKSVGRDCEIVAVFDVHTDADSQDKGFDELRRRAAEVGADAVIGAEFEHGDDGEKSHLSGMAVKWTKPRPAYDPIGEIDIPSNEDDEDKGLDKMREEAKQMGADEVVNVQFEHGEEGQMGHLTGLAVKYRR